MSVAGTPREPTHVLNNIQIQVIDAGICSSDQTWRYILHQTSQHLHQSSNLNDRLQFYRNLLEEVPGWKRERLIEKNLSSLGDSLLNDWLDLLPSKSNSSVSEFDYVLHILSGIDNFVRNEIITDFECFLQFQTEWSPSNAHCTLTQEGTLEILEYPMNLQPRGIMFLVNNLSFSRSRERRGCDKDKLALLEVAARYGLKVIEFSDYGCKKLLFCLEHELELIHKDAIRINLVFTVVMTHGGFDSNSSTEKLICRFCDSGEHEDCQNGYTSEDLVKLFIEAPSLKLIPRVFIIQACRSNIGLSQQASFEDSVAESSVPPKPKRSRFEPSLSSSTSMQDESHVFIIRSAVAGSVSYRDVHNGSFLIQDLCHVMQNVSSSLSFHQLHHSLIKCSVERSVSGKYSPDIFTVYEATTRMAATSKQLVFYPIIK